MRGDLYILLLGGIPRKNTVPGLWVLAIKSVRAMGPSNGGGRASVLFYCRKRLPKTTRGRKMGGIIEIWTDTDHDNKYRYDALEMIKVKYQWICRPTLQSNLALPPPLSVGGQDFQIEGFKPACLFAHKFKQIGARANYLGTVLKSEQPIWVGGILLGRLQRSGGCST